jgi:type IV pilus assembly protein PilC
MRKFKYLAVNRIGEQTIDVMYANNEEEVIKKLKLEKLRLVNIREVREHHPGSQNEAARTLKNNISALFARLGKLGEGLYDRFHRVNERTLCLFTQQLCTMLEAGINVTAGLRSIGMAESDRKFKKVIDRLIESMESGLSAYQSFASFPDVFSMAYSGLIRVGESSGRLPFVLNRQAQDLEKFYTFKKRTIASLTYPAFILIFAVVSVLIMTIYFVPSFSRIYSDMKMKLPFITMALVIVVQYLTNPYSWIAVLIVILIATFMLRSYSATPVGKYAIDSVKVRLPLVGELVINNHLYTTFLNLACMLECGVTISEALKILRDMSENQVFKEFLHDSLTSIKEGSSLYTALKDRWFIPRYAIDLIQTGESTGDLPDMVRRAAEMMEERVNERLEAFLAMLEPVIISFLALAVGFIMIAIFLPLYNVISQFSP